MCNMIRKALPKRQKRSTNWFGWWGLFHGAELRDHLIKFLTLVGKEIIQNIDKDVFLAPAPNLERSENISWNMSTSRRLGAIHQLSRDRIICQQVYHGLSFWYEIWNEFESFTQVYEALLLLVQTEVICSKRKISAIILVLDIAATMVGGTRIYWGDQERLLWSKFTWFLRVLLSGVSKTAATTTISYKTNNLGSFKEMTNVHQGWKEKGEVVTFWEGRKWRGNGEWRWPIWLS